MKPLDELIEQVGSYEALIELLYDICALTECGLDIDETVERLDQIPCRDLFKVFSWC